MALPANYLRAVEQLSVAFGAYESAKGIPPVLVGGAAAAIRTGEKFMSADLDVVAEDEGAFTRALASAGFVAEARTGRSERGYYHPEFPAFAVDLVSNSYFHGRGDRARLLRLVVRDYATIVIPAVEDLIADRLGQYARGGNTDCSRLLQARELLRLASRIDRLYLRRRIAEEGGDATLIESEEAGCERSR
jgi:hypothetical protein